MLEKNYKFFEPTREFDWLKFSTLEEVFFDRNRHFLFRLDSGRLEDLEKYSPNLVPVAVSISKNWDRVSSLILLPGVISYFALATQLRHDLGSQKAVNEIICDELDSIQKELIGEEKSKIGIKECYETLCSCATDEMVKYENEIGDTLVRLVESVIVNSWTAFEVLVADLWIATVNARRNKLTDIVSKAKGDNTDGQQAKEQMVKVSVIQKRGFDLRHCMGNVLFEKFNFKSLNGIRDTYAKTFGKGNVICEHLKDKNLWALHQIRNVYAHKGGRIDDDFIKNMDSHPEFGVLKLGEFLRVDGASAARLTESAFNACQEVLFSVHEWLKANPD